MLFLAFFIMLWGYGEFVQLRDGMIVTNLNDQVSWGMYLANFVCMVGVAAAAVTVVFPAYVYKHKELHKIVVLGEMLAIAAVVICLLFIVAQMGRPDRLWHIFPIIGIWIEKSLGLMLPGVIPTPVGEFAEYVPSAIELMVIGVVWAIGFLILTVLIKGAVGILLGEVKYAEDTGLRVRQEGVVTT